MTTMTTAEPFEPYELWRPVVRPERRNALESIHKSIASKWRETLSGLMRTPGSVAFAGSHLGGFAQVINTAEDEVSEALVCRLERLRLPVLLVADVGLGMAIIATQLGSGSFRGKESRGEDRGENFSALERAVIHRALSRLLERLSESYIAAGFGAAIQTRRATNCRDLATFGPEDYVISFRYSLELGSNSQNPGELTVILPAGVMNAIPDGEHSPKQITGNSAVKDVIMKLPVGIEVVLARWKIKLIDIYSLKAGDLILLPGPNVGDLYAGGRHIGEVEIRWGNRDVSLIMASSGMAAKGPASGSD